MITPDAAMSGEPFPLRPMPPKLRRVLELVYGVEGVVSARVWQWPGRIAVGVRGGSATSPTDLIRRIEMAVAGLREADERWDFGILEDAAAVAQDVRAPGEEDAQFATKIASISVLTCSSVCSRAIAISFTMSVRAVSSMRRSPKESCLSVFRR